MDNLNRSNGSDTEEMVGETQSTFLPVPIPNGFDATKTPKPRSGIQPQKALTIYQREKRQGLRRANGARKLKKLSNRHLEIIARHLDAQSGERISAEMNITVITVSRVLNDPLCTDLLNRIFADRQSEIDALAGKAIDVVRDGLTGDYTLREKLTAVDKYAKLKDTIGKTEGSTETAEDVIAKMYKHLSVENMQVNINLGDN